MAMSDRGVIDAPTFDHFAYGSNMSMARLRKRCPSAMPVAIGFVRGRQLRFQKLGRDGTSKADAFATGDGRHRLWGVVVRILVSERSVLDGCESLGIGYDFVPVEVGLETGTCQSHLYAARPDQIDAGLRPAAWYVRHVLDGAREHQLPQAYQRTLRRMVMM